MDEETEQGNASAENIEKIAQVRARHEERISPQHRAIASFASKAGRPWLLWAELALVTLWFFVWAILRSEHRPVFDPAPFFWLQGLVGLSALLLTTLVLIGQNRDRHLAERHAQMDTQVTLLVEQKVTKLIELIEELRRDLPIRDREDPQIEAMKQSVDPRALAAELDRAGGATANLPADEEP